MEVIYIVVFIFFIILSFSLRTNKQKMKSRNLGAHSSFIHKEHQKEDKQSGSVVDEEEIE